MDNASFPLSPQWCPEFERILGTVSGAVSHGSLIDIREPLRRVISAERPLVMLCPSAADIDKIVGWFKTKRPGAIILPPATDAHVAHRMTRALAAIGLVGANLQDTLVLTGWTPWGPLPQPNAYFSYDGEAERTKEWAIHCHASQVLLTDYTKYCSHLGRAYAALAREWAEGHSLSGRAHRTDERFVGVELFQIESYDPTRCDPKTVTDPILIALACLRDKNSAGTAKEAVAVSV